VKIVNFSLWKIAWIALKSSMCQKYLIEAYQSFILKIRILM